MLTTSKSAREAVLTSLRVFNSPAPQMRDVPLHPFSPWRYALRTARYKRERWSRCRTQNGIGPHYGRHVLRTRHSNRQRCRHNLVASPLNPPTHPALWCAQMSPEPRTTKPTRRLDGLRRVQNDFALTPTFAQRHRRVPDGSTL